MIEKMNWLGVLSYAVFYEESKKKYEKIHKKTPTLTTWP
jgi:hypothetical protein